MRTIPTKQKRMAMTVVCALLLMMAVFLWVSLRESAELAEQVKGGLKLITSPSNVDDESTGVIEFARNVNGKQQIWKLSWQQDNIVRVQIQAPGKPTDPNTAVLSDKLQFTDSQNRDKLRRTPIECEDTVRRTTLSAGDIRVEVDKFKATLAFYDREGTRFLKMLTPDDFDYEIAFEHQVGEQFYGIHGFNANQDSFQKMVRDGAAVIEAGTQGNAGAPYIWSRDGFGVLFDTTAGNFSNFEGVLALQNRSKSDAQFFVMTGKPVELQQSLAALTGKPPMFPKWSLGFNNSEWGIDQPELLRDVALYREKRIPIDNYTLDFDWKAWGEDDYGESRWNEVKFPDGKSGKLGQMLGAQGIKLTGIMKPRIHVDTVQGRYATEQGFWWPGLEPFDDYFSRQKVNVLNFALPEMRAWYFNDYVRQAFRTGIIGWWNDEADEMYDNLQFMNMQKTLYEGQRSISKQRVWSINRNFFLGSQRYAYGMWSGDISTGFFSMAKQRERMLSAVNIGQVKWGMDSGGFHGTPSPENYARWIQFSAFTPMFRVHGTLDEQRQPWYYGEQAEQVAKAAIELRYRFVPYMYSYERRAYETGIGLVKPLFYDYPTDEQVANDVDSWMFGDHLLVAPVVDESQSSKPIYLPAGQWTDYFSGKVYDGGQTIQYPIDAGSWRDIPLFIKAGAIIPTYPVMNYIDEKPVERMKIDVFPASEESQFILYDDDGVSYDYENGVYMRQVLRAQKSGNQVEIRLERPTGSYDSQTKSYILRVHGLQAKSVSGFSSIWTVGKDVYGEYTELEVPAGRSLNLRLE